MDLPHIGALSLFISYFLIIIWLLALIVNTIYSNAVSRNSAGKKTIIFIGLALASFAHTWFYMFKYMTWSFDNHETSFKMIPEQDLLHQVASWLYDTSLFEEAWRAVCSRPLNWWWSEQLCTFTVGAWTLFLAVEGNKHRVKHLWAYMLFGQIVAISVASNLFYIALILSRPSASTKIQAPKSTVALPQLWFSVLLSYATVAISPHTSRQTFLPNLLIMHALLFIPLIRESTAETHTKFSVDVKSLYRISQILAATIHIRTVMSAVKVVRQDSASTSLISVAWSVLHSHPAQSSIGWDVIWSSISFTAWILSNPDYYPGLSSIYKVLYLILATPISSLGVTAPYILRSTGQAVVDEKQD